VNEAEGHFNNKKMDLGAYLIGFQGVYLHPPVLFFSPVFFLRFWIFLRAL
jgi:hypothetical protein